MMPIGEAPDSLVIRVVLSGFLAREARVICMKGAIERKNPATRQIFILEADFATVRATEAELLVHCCRLVTPLALRCLGD